MSNRFVDYQMKQEEASAKASKVEQKTSTDAIVEQIEKEPDSIRSGKLTFQKKQKEIKSVHKNFAITENLDRKFKALANKTGMSENELFNEILKSVLEEES